MLKVYLNCTAQECSDAYKARYTRVCGPGCMDYEEKELRRIFGDTTYELMRAYEARGYAVQLSPWPCRKGAKPPFKKRFSDKDERPFPNRPVRNVALINVKD